MSDEGIRDSYRQDYRYRIKHRCSLIQLILIIRWELRGKY